MADFGLTQWLYRRRTAVLIAIHAVLYGGAYGLATLLRFDFAIPHDSQTLLWRTLPWIVLVRLACALALQSFHGRLRYVTFHDLVVLLRATSAGTLMIVIIDYFVMPGSMIPRSIVVLDFLMNVLLVGAVRSIGRLSSEQLVPLIRQRTARDPGQRRALIVGANPRGVYVAGQIRALPELNTQIVGFLDVDPALQGRRLGGFFVYGSPTEVDLHAQTAEANEILIVADVLSGKTLRTLIDRCRETKLSVKILPGVEDFLTGRGTAGPSGLRLRDVDINDLLRRDPVQLDNETISNFIKGKTVLVTGAGGSIGSEICRQLLGFEPARLVLVERAENNLFQIDRELQNTAPTTEIIPCIADVTDADRMRKIFSTYRPQVLFHAAAHKHVPMMEHNPGEAIKNNTFGTRLLADMAHEFELQSFVLISTDKAVNPTSVMGLSKQLAENYIHALSQTSSTRFIAVRFGNVLGSVGSVVPIFQEQIRNGGPVTVTHPEMRRYFMTIPEASQLVLQAGAMGKGGEIFVLDMGEPVRIVDLARDVVRLSGLAPDEIEIVFTGMRPGEKLFEELYFDDERTLPTPHPKLRVAYHRSFALEEVEHLFDELREVAEATENEFAHRRLRELLPEFAVSVSEERTESRSESPESSPRSSLSPLRHGK
jgi:FlaA1/EpsC-like NDP-sugar epimerase